MRHLKKTKKFHRKKGQRKALFKTLLNNFILQEKIETTEIKAKALRSKAEKLITIAKKQNLAILRILLSRLTKKSAQKLYYEIASRYANRQSGYIRLIKSRTRKADGARMAFIEFV